MLSDKNPFLRVSILSTSGISLYHRSFSRDEDLDEQLFSGFTSAILSFIREMGNQLNSLSMKGMDLYFKQSSECIVVLGVNSEYKENDSILNAIDEISSLPEIEGMLDQFKNNIVEVQPGLESRIIRILSKASIENIQISSDHELIENTEIAKSLNKYLNDELKAKQLAVELIGQNLEQSEADKKFGTTQMIIDLINSSEIEKDTRKKLNNLLNEMKKSSTKAAAKVNKALF